MPEDCRCKNNCLVAVICLVFSCVLTCALITLLMCARCEREKKALVSELASLSPAELELRFAEVLYEERKQSGVLKLDLSFLLRGTLREVEKRGNWWDQQQLRCTGRLMNLRRKWRWVCVMEYTGKHERVFRLARACSTTYDAWEPLDENLDAMQIEDVKQLEDALGYPLQYKLQREYGMMQIREAMTRGELHGILASIRAFEHSGEWNPVREFYQKLAAKYLSADDVEITDVQTASVEVADAEAVHVENAPVRVTEVRD